MAGFRWRFRKSFTIIPKLLKFTINKKSWSLNFKLGPYSRSWGSARSTSGIDLPGEYGFYMHKDHRKNHPEAKKGGFDALIIVGFFLVWIFHWLLGAFQTWALPFFADEKIVHPHFLLWGLLMIAELSLVWKTRKSLTVLFLFFVLGSVANWILFAWFIV